MSDGISEELGRYFNHIAANVGTFQTSSDIENTIYTQLKDQGFVFFSTPIIHHGIHEYKGPTAQVLAGVNTESLYFLRQSAQFEKQLIVMAGKKPYFQKAFCFRPGEEGKFHTPYHNQIDMEIPFNGDGTTHVEAKEKVLSVALGIIASSLAVGGKVIESVSRISYDRSLEEYGNDAPFTAPAGKNGINITIVENPPLLKNQEGDPETVIHPMAQPIFTPEQERRFVSGEMGMDEMRTLKVYGYDIVASAPGMFEDGETPKGLEISGGSVRIKNPDVQRRVVELTLPQYVDDYRPLIALLTRLRDAPDFSAGAAVGLERLIMCATDAKAVQNVLPLPWYKNAPPFGLHLK